MAVKLKQHRDNKQYQALFDEFNQRYFGGKLPRYRIQVVDCISLEEGDEIPLDYEGENIRHRRLILLKRMVKADMISTLLHEMAHTATDDAHTKRWGKEIERLCRAGAPISEDILIAPPRLTKVFVRAVAEDLLGERPDTTLWEFARWVVYKYGYAPSPTAFLRKYPWVRRILSDVRKAYKNDLRRHKNFSRKEG